jgi:hypothetical protein|tara:strand:- start:416 stop:667 length:252 start_codon:yes stop_codon:yes gene_type:complete
MAKQPPQMNIDLNNTESVEHKNGRIWTQGFLIRKISKFVAGTDEDAMMPIPIFYDSVSGEILQATLPKELRDDQPKKPLRVVD